jgi:dihydroorotate dehydrogenase (fumarate)
MSLAVTGGFHERDDILKAILAGADAVQLCSALLLHGSAHLRELLNALECWLDEHDYESVVQCKGSVSQQHAIEPAAYARANYVHLLDSYTAPAGVLR